MLYSPVLYTTLVIKEVKSPGSGVMGDCELPGVNAGTKPRSSTWVARAFDYRAIISPSLPQSVFWGTAHFIHFCAWIPWRRDSGTDAWLGERPWQMVVCWGKLSQAAGVSSSLYRDGAQRMPPHTLGCWHTDYFELKTYGEHQTQK